MVAITTLLATLLTLVAPTPAGAVVNGPGRLDPTFQGGYAIAGFSNSNGGTVDTVRAVAADPISGNIWAAGDSTNGFTTMSVAVFHPDGSVPPPRGVIEPANFLAPILPGSTGQVVRSAVYDQFTGRLYILGYSSGVFGDFIAAFKFNAALNGGTIQLDTTFNGGKGMVGNSFAAVTGAFRSGSLSMHPTTHDGITRTERSIPLSAAAACCRPTPPRRPASSSAASPCRTRPITTTSISPDPATTPCIPAPPRR
jgi:hypothetical protein